jgi:hypothetical protein
MSNLSSILVPFPVLFAVIGSGAADEPVRHNEKETAAICSEVENEIKLAWSSSDRTSNGPDYFGTNGLQKLRDQLTSADVDAISQLSDRTVPQFFAFQTAVVRFPNRCTSVAVVVALTSNHPANPLMAPVFDRLKLSDPDSFNNSTLSEIERVPIRAIVNSALFAHTLKTAVLEKWFNARSTQMPALLKACFLDEMCSRIPREKWSPLMRSILDSFGDKDGTIALPSCRPTCGTLSAHTLAQPTPVAALVVSGMNDVLNSQGYTQAGYWNRIPTAAWALMAVIAIGCNVLVGYGSRSVTAGSKLLPILPLVVSIAFMLIADIDSPRQGIA